jgi:hypothetical protein
MKAFHFVGNSGTLELLSNLWLTGEASSAQPRQREVSEVRTMSVIIALVAAVLVVRFWRQVLVGVAMVVIALVVLGIMSLVRADGNFSLFAAEENSGHHSRPVTQAG